MIDLEKAVEWSQKGLTLREVAKVLGCATCDLLPHAQKLRDAKAMGRAMLKAQAYELAKEGKPALMFRLQRDKDKKQKRKINFAKKVATMSADELTQALAK